jgi:hypothetical protein
MVVHNSHYVARHLTTPWEFGQRKLWVYEFERDHFSTVSSKRLLTSEAPWDDAIEHYLDRYLESPLSRFLARFHKTRDSNDIKQDELRALKLAIVLQVPRTANDTVDLGELAEKGEDYLNGLTAALDHRLLFVHIPLRQESLCFPEHGLIMVPLHGSPPAMGIALHPSYLTVAVPRPAEPFLKQIDWYMKSDVDVFGALSVGLDQCRRVIIPGYAFGQHDEPSMRAMLKLCRFRGKHLVQVMLDANAEDFGAAFPGLPIVRSGSA